MASQGFFDLTAGQLRQFENVISPYAPCELARAISQDPNLAALAFGYLLDKRVPKPDIENGLFLKLEGQLQNIREWNVTYAWGMDERELVSPKHPALSCNKLAYPVLFPYLRSPAQTFLALWQVIADTHEKTAIDQVVLRLLEADSGHVFFSTSSTWKIQTTSWETVHFGDKGPLGHMLGRYWPSLSILAMAAHSPWWVRRLGDGAIPIVCFPGIRIFRPSRVDAVSNPERLVLTYDREFRAVNCEMWTEQQIQQSRMRIAVPTIVT